MPIYTEETRYKLGPERQAHTQTSQLLLSTIKVTNNKK
jgi:hypothetical protein